MPMDVAPDVPVALPDAPAAAPAEAPMQIDVAPEAPAPALYPPAPALEVAAARERAKYEEMQRSLKQDVAMWKKRSQRLSRINGTCPTRDGYVLYVSRRTVPGSGWALDACNKLLGS